MEEIIAGTFHGSRIFRLDQDSSRKKDAIFDLIEKMRAGEIDILLGTQMVAKGFDFHNVAVVGVILADIGLNSTDFRASERVFSLLLQVAGRGGRGDVPGRVIIQTLNEDNALLKFLGRHDYEGFYRHELAARKALGYPPFSRLINFRMEGASRKKTADFSDRLGALAHSLLRKEGRFRDGIELLGPAAAPWEKIKGKYRFQMAVKGSSLTLLRGFASRLISRAPEMIKGSGVAFSVDVDPVSLL